MVTNLNSSERTLHFFYLASVSLILDVRFVLLRSSGCLPSTLTAALEGPHFAFSTNHNDTRSSGK